MKTAAISADGDTATYDIWFKTQVQQAIDDPRPGIAANAARKHFAARRDALRQQAQAKR
jgi:hypothetical protein